MDISAFQTHGKIDIAKFHKLPALIDTFDERQRKSFAQAIVDKLLGRSISTTEVDIVIDVLVDLAVKHAPEDWYVAALRKRWAA